tara:strand:+ start:9334 stop:10518 length:1185 start_codon:yes stop_codon:yes gene_type:complete
MSTNTNDNAPMNMEMKSLKDEGIPEFSTYLQRYLDKGYSMTDAMNEARREWSSDNVANYMKAKRKRDAIQRQMDAYLKTKGGKKKTKKKTKKQKQKKKTTKKRGKSSKKRTRRLKKLQCAPTGNEVSYTCISPKSICKLKTLWNNRHPDDKIKDDMSHKKTWEALKSKMAGTCDKESCWLKQNFSKKEMTAEMKKAFAPEHPAQWNKNPNEWLSSSDITAVMKQYEKRYKCFSFIGPSPIDYDTHKLYGECVWEELCHFNVANEIKKNKNKIGIIFNTDPHYKGGSHWVSLFINIKKGKIFYFDSVGKKPPVQIKKFMEKVRQQGINLPEKINFSLDMNHPMEHQFGNTECGIYSLYFIISLLEDKHDLSYFKKTRIPDKKIQKFRKVYFNTSL